MPKDNSKTNDLVRIEKDIRNIKTEIKSLIALVSTKNNVTMNDVQKSIELLEKHDKSISEKCTLAEAKIAEKYKKYSETLEVATKEYTEKVEKQLQKSQFVLSENIYKKGKELMERAKIFMASYEKPCKELITRLNKLNDDYHGYVEVINDFNEKKYNIDKSNDDLLIESNEAVLKYSDVIEKLRTEIDSLDVPLRRKIKLLKDVSFDLTGENRSK